VARKTNKEINVLSPARTRSPERLRRQRVILRVDLYHGSVSDVRIAAGPCGGRQTVWFVTIAARASAGKEFGSGLRL